MTFRFRRFPAARAAAAVLLPLFLAACGAESKWADDASVARAAYQHPGPPTVTLFTSYNMRGHEGVHSGLMISGEERIFFDPAGSWYNPAAPERNDVHFGITPGIENAFIDYHARPTYYVARREIEVSPETAAIVAERARSYGAVDPAFCTYSVSAVLRGLPEFEDLRTSWFPGQLDKTFASLPGVRTTYYYDDDTLNGNPLRVQAVPDDA